MLSRQEQARLLGLARRTLEAYLRGQPAPALERGGVFDEPLGAFVTLHHRGELRGCLGRIDPAAPLGQTVAELAAIVSDSDPRFSPVRVEELADISIEISILTPEEEVQEIEQIAVGRHGLIIEQGSRRGLLLPQVAVERGWDAATFLAHACTKAGLPQDAWRHGARILKFEAQVFGENVTL